MGNTRHPLFTVLTILGVIGLFLVIVMIVVVTALDPSTPFTFQEKIGVVPIEGTISESEDLISQIVDFRKDKKIKAIILRVDSPGGGVGPSQEIYREIQKTLEKKKVIASLGSVAASGGYYIACAANKIVANPGTITGSIGVIMEFVTVEDLMNKIGVGLEVLKSGEFKDIGSPHRKLTDREKEILQKLIAEVQEQFVQAVAKGRKIPVEKVREVADGRVFSGARAKELTLVDSLGNFQDAVELAKNMAGIEGEAALIYPKKKGLSILDIFFGEAAKIAVRELKDLLRGRIEYRWQDLAGPLN